MPYEDGRVAYEQGMSLLEQGKMDQALDKFTIAMFEGYEKSYASIGAILVDPNNGYANPSLAKELFEMGVAAGHSRAMFNLARMYEKGYGITQSDEMALNLYKQAQAIEPKNRALASKVHILEGRISAKSTTESSVKPSDYISTSPSVVSSTRGDGLYQKAIALEKQGNRSAAFQAYMQASFMGNTKAYSSIGLYLLTGITGAVPINKALAKKYLEMGVAAEQPRAMLNLARMYEKGDGVAQSDKIALDLYKMAQSYDSSNVVLADKINLLERRLRENAGVKKPVGVDAEIHRAPVSEVDNNAMYRNHLHQIVVGLNINAEFSAELNRGTASTPGEHLRFSAYPEAYHELAALKSALDEAGISYEERVKGMGGLEKILVIREVPRIRPGFETKLRQNYAAALDKITAEASAKHARTDAEVDRKQELDTLRDNLKALSVSSMGADPYQGEKNSSEIATLIDQVGNLHSLLNSLEAKTILPEEAVGLRAFFMTKQNIREFKTACAACLQSFPEERRAEASVYLGSIKKMYNEALTTVKSNLDSIALSSGHDIDERKGLDMR